MNPSRPAQADPARLVQVIRDQQVTNSFGSPALWDRVSRFCLGRGITLPSIRRILIAGAPVRGELVERLKRVIPAGAEVHTPYGATEALPVTSIRGAELLNRLADRSRRGAGICVGKPVGGIEVDVVPISDQSIEAWNDDLPVADEVIGEIVASGPVVAQEYFGLPMATQLAKIRHGNRVYHRMGDIGYRDESGRIWFCGRKAHRVTTATGTLFTIPCEAIFNEHQDVLRSALVGVGPKGRQVPVIIIEPRPGRFPNRRRRSAMVDELLALSRPHEHTRSIEHVLFHRRFPVDVRHNAKINREALAAWAEKRVQSSDLRFQI